MRRSSVQGSNAPRTQSRGHQLPIPSIQMCRGARFLRHRVPRRVQHRTIRRTRHIGRHTPRPNNRERATRVRANLPRPPERISTAALAPQLRSNPRPRLAPRASMSSCNDLNSFAAKPLAPAKFGHTRGSTAFRKPTRPVPSTSPSSTLNRMSETHTYSRSS